jgi:hypothetical protein
MFEEFQTLSAEIFRTIFKIKFTSIGLRISKADHQLYILAKILIRSY